nr:MAG TPA: tail repeat-like protein [Caudoviricetes sp.]
MALNFTIRNLSQTEDEKTFHVEQTEIKRVVNVGATYTPAVSEEGVISWTNDQKLPNPAPVNIKGPAGPAPAVTVSKVGKVATVTIGTETFTLTDGADGQGSGDMLKATYDANDNGIVDNAEKLGGKSASEFAAAAHSHKIADVNGLQAALDGKINTTYTLSITGNAIVLTPSSGDAQQIEIPLATASALGLVKIGTGLAIAADGTISNAYSMSYADGVLDIYGP